MGCNYYLRRTVPRMVPTYDETHIAKQSWGWKPHFQATEPWEGTDQRPTILSVQDIRDAVASGEWEICSEEEAITLDDFEQRVVQWVDRQRELRGDDDWEPLEPSGSYRDAEGFVFDRREFC